jgi:hypothetical protein
MEFVVVKQEKGLDCRYSMRFTAGNEQIERRPASPDCTHFYGIKPPACNYRLRFDRILETAHSVSPTS